MTALTCPASSHSSLASASRPAPKQSLLGCFGAPSPRLHRDEGLLLRRQECMERRSVAPVRGPIDGPTLPLPGFLLKGLRPDLAQEVLNRGDVPTLGGMVQRCALEGSRPIPDLELCSW